MADATANRYMPPWHAARAEGFAEFADERLLTQRDLDTIQAWVAASMPSGDLRRRPRRRRFQPDGRSARPISC